MNNIIYSGTGTGESATESLKKIFTNPILYIVLGSIVLLIIIFYLVRRNIKARDNASIIVIRKGNIHKIVDSNSPSYYLVPFTDRVGAVIPLGEQSFASDKLYINDGPDALYQVNYVLNYKVVDPSLFYKCMNNFQEKAVISINDTLREYADKGNASVLVRDYRNNEKEIISLLNNALSQFSVEPVSFKVNFIVPLGKK